MRQASSIARWFLFRQTSAAGHAASQDARRRAALDEDAAARRREPAAVESPRALRALRIPEAPNPALGQIATPGAGRK
jgi:hypothetical protein